jgi:tripartite-type tricarboxylate transporter receptor subunit TctC
MKRASFLKGVGALALAPAVGRAQGAWPDKQIRMVIPFAAGGTTDLLARALGQHMTQAWGQPVVADNLMVAMGHAINPLLYKKLPYDGTADFTPISLVATFPQLVLVRPTLKANTIAELIALAKSASPPLTYASGGNGSSQHLAGALFEHMAGVTMTHVAYKGGNPAQLDLMAGNVDMMITQPNSKDLITTGKMRPLAVSSAKRSSFYPDLPTVDEAGVAGYQSVAWYGLVGPKGMPPGLLNKIADEAVRAAATEGARSVVAQQGGDMVASTPVEFASFIEAERSRYETIVREAGMTVD